MIVRVVYNSTPGAIRYHYKEDPMKAIKVGEIVYLKNLLDAHPGAFIPQWKLKLVEYCINKYPEDCI